MASYNDHTVEGFIFWLASRGADVGRLDSALRSGALDAVKGLPVTWNGRLRSTAGRCEFKRAITFLGGGTKPVRFAVAIDLNPKLREEGIEAIRLTFTHELSHAIAGYYANHGPAFKRTDRALGGTGSRCHTYQSMRPQRRRRRVRPSVTITGAELRERILAMRKEAEMRKRGEIS